MPKLPKHDERGLQRCDRVGLETVALRFQAVQLCRSHHVAGGTSVTRDAASHAQFFERHGPAEVSDNHAEAGRAAFNGLELQDGRRAGAVRRGAHSRAGNTNAIGRRFSTTIPAEHGVPDAERGRLRGKPDQRGDPSASRSSATWTSRTGRVITPAASASLWKTDLMRCDARHVAANDAVDFRIRVDRRNASRHPRHDRLFGADRNEDDCLELGQRRFDRRDHVAAVHVAGRYHRDLDDGPGDRRARHGDRVRSAADPDYGVAATDRGTDGAHGGDDAVARRDDRLHPAAGYELPRTVDRHRDRGENTPQERGHEQRADGSQREPRPRGNDDEDVFVSFTCGCVLDRLLTKERRRH